MTREDAAAFVAERYGKYLSAAGRAPNDSAAGLKGAIDDSLRAIGYATADLPTAEPTDAEIEEDLRVQVAYRSMAQITRDLGATAFNISTGGDSFSLNQMRLAAEKDLAEAKSAVLARFGTLGTATSDGGIVTLDLNFLEPTVDELAEAYG